MAFAIHLHRTAGLMHTWAAVGVHSVVLLLLLLSCEIAGETVYIGASGSDDEQFRKALEKNTVDKIIFTSDYSLGSQFDKYSGPYKEGSPIIRIDRNVTVTGVQGKPPVLLDMRFLQTVVELCDTCTFSILNIAITNERKGANAQLDFFLGTGNSLINLTNVVRKRMSCTPIGPALQLVERTSRAPKFPAANGSTRQIYDAQDITFRGQWYPQTLHLIDYSALFIRLYNGGYNLVLYNVYRMCEHFVEVKCLAASDADVCVYEQIEQLLSGQAAGGGAAGAVQLTAGAVAGIAIAAALAAALVAAGLWLFVRRRRQHHQLPIGPVQGSKHVGNSSFRGATAKDADYGPPGPPQTIVTLSAAGVDGGSRTDGSKDTKGTADSSDSILGTSAAALHHDLPGGNSNGDLRFGPLLGCGSFGRVYKARWMDKDVAVKVIEHDYSMAAAVTNEVQLMLSCNHPNVVRAYHYITINPNRSQAGSLVIKPLSSAGDCVANSSEASISGQNASSVGSKTASRALGSLQLLLPPLQISGSTGNTPSQQLQQRQHSGSDQAHSSDRVLPIQQLQVPPPRPQHDVKSLLLTQQLPVPKTPFAADLLSPGDVPPTVMLPTESEWEMESVKTWLIQEYCDSGTLSKMSNTWLPVSEDDAQMLKRLALLQDVGRGLAYLHGRSVVHGDLNARNVLITSNANSICGYSAKLADLGLSRTIKQHATHHTTCTVGTMSHMPPELLRSGRMSTAVDVYSLGIMMFEMYSREVAFRELHYGQFFETVVLKDLRPRIPPGMPDDYKLLMERCWATDPNDRPSARTVVECIGLMIADRQRSLGIPETGSSIVDHGSSSSVGYSYADSAAASGSVHGPQRV